jgi:hypothetical protein
MHVVNRFRTFGFPGHKLEVPRSPFSFLTLSTLLSCSYTTTSGRRLPFISPTVQLASSFCCLNSRWFAAEHFFLCSAAVTCCLKVWCCPVEFRAKEGYSEMLFGILEEEPLWSFTFAFAGKKQTAAQTKRRGSNIQCTMLRKVSTSNRKEKATSCKKRYREQNRICYIIHLPGGWKFSMISRENSIFFGKSKGGFLPLRSLPLFLIEKRYTGSTGSIVVACSFLKITW